MGDPFTDVEQGPQVDEDQLKKVGRLVFGQLAGSTSGAARQLPRVS